MRKRQNGFSLIELMIVVVIILVIAAVAIPNLLGAKMSANEASAVSSMRTLHTACITYTATYNIGFPAALSNLGPATVADYTAADLIDSVLVSGVKSGYSFVYASGTPDATGYISSYAVNVNPSAPGQTGVRFFYSDQSGVITYAYGAPATSTDAAF